jgi:hypothetical protein
MSRRAHIKRQTKPGQPEVVVDQTADELDDREAIRAIKKGLREADQGKGMSLQDFDRRMRRKYKIPKAS